MEIPLDLIKTVNSCSPESVKVDQLRHILQIVSQDILNSFKKQTDMDAHKSLSTLGIDPSLVKDIYTGLTVLIAEGTKNNINEEEMRSFLEECNWQEDKINLLIDTYCKHRLSYIGIAQKIGSNFPNIVGIDWRLDYYIKNKDMDKVNQPVYLIKLKVEVQGKATLEEITFSCSFEELQDLVGKLKDVCKTIERIGQS